MSHTPVTTNDLGPRPRPSMSSAPKSKQRLAVIGALQSCRGEVSDKSGRTTAILMAQMSPTPTPKALAALLSAMERDNDIAREVRGKRTFKIRLVGYDGSVEHVEHVDEDVDKDVDKDVDEDVDVIPATTLDEQSWSAAAIADATQQAIWHSLAHALLTEVGSILANGQDTDKGELLTRLHALTQDNLLLKRKMEAAFDILHVREKELEGLRARLAATESNLQRVLKQAKTSQPLDGQSQKAIERFMQERPHERAG